jgi:xanthine dehydrogenase YagR molybdenum-binding subunit
MFADVSVGDADGVFADCPVRIDDVFDCPPQHPVPLELIGCVAEWDGDRLVIHEGTRTPTRCGTAWPPSWALTPRRSG